MIKEYKKNIKKCPNCSSIWTFDTSDVHNKIIYDGFLGEYTENFIICPKCGDHITVFNINNVWR